jgi:hypothetical protein
VRLIAIIVVLLFLSPLAIAQSFFGGGSYTRRGNNESVRWTLADWMSQKKQFSVMDQWLAINKQANFIEFNIQGGQANYDLNVNGTTTKQKVTTFSAQLWVSIFGLQYVKADSDEDWESESYQLNVRLFGQSSQTTSLTAFYGMKEWTDLNAANSYDTQFAGGRLNLYLVSFVGLEASYQKNFKASDSLGREIDSYSSDYGIFVDLNFVRLYGKAFYENATITQGGVPQTEKRDGVDAGVQFYF